MIEAVKKKMTKDNLQGYISFLEQQQLQNEEFNDNLKERINQFDKVYRSICTELDITYGGVDVDSGEIVKAIRELKNG